MSYIKIIQTYEVRIKLSGVASSFAGSSLTFSSFFLCNMHWLALISCLFLSVALTSVQAQANEYGI